jgi:hypothetical protein
MRRLASVSAASLRAARSSTVLASNLFMATMHLLSTISAHSNDKAKFRETVTSVKVAITGRASRCGIFAAEGAGTILSYKLASVRQYPDSCISGHVARESGSLVSSSGSKAASWASACFTRSWGHARNAATFGASIGSCLGRCNVTRRFFVLRDGESGIDGTFPPFEIISGRAEFFEPG